MAGEAAAATLSWPEDAMPCAMAMAPSGELLATGLSNLAGSVWDGQVSLHRAGDLKPAAAAKLEYGATSVSWVSNHQLVAGMDNGDVAVVDVSKPSHTEQQQGDGAGVTAVVTAALPAHDDCVSSVASKLQAGSAADGKDATFATGSWDGSVKVWPSTVGSTPQGKLVGHFGRVFGVAWQPHTPGTNLLASCGEDGRCLVWDVRSMSGPAVVAAYRMQGSSAGQGSVVAKSTALLPHASYGDLPLTALAWVSPTQLALSAADGGVMLVDLRDVNKPVVAFAGGVHAGPVHAILAPAGKTGTLITAGDDGKVAMASVTEEGALTSQHTWPEQKEYVRCLATATGGEALLAGVWDGTTQQLAFPAKP